MTAIPAYDPSNILAKIIRGELPSVKVFEDADILAIMDIFPQSDGHALVIHKRATAAMIFDLTPAELTTLATGVQKIARAVDKALKPDGLRIMQFNGAEAGQTIFHTHFHVIPAYAGRPLGSHGTKPADCASLEKLAELIAKAL